MNGLNTLSLLQKAFIVAPEKRNVGTMDRVISTTAGILMAYALAKNFNRKRIPYMLPAGYLIWRGLSGYCPGYNLFGIDTTEGSKPINFSESIIIHRRREDVYKYWRKLENLPKIMTHISKVENLSNNKYYWEAEFNKQHFSWNAQIFEDIPNEKISWMSVDSPDVENAGTIEFMDTQEGNTEIRISISYKPAKTKIDKLMAQAINPIFKRKVMSDLQEFKYRMEMVEA